MVLAEKPERQLQSYLSFRHSVVGEFRYCLVPEVSINSERQLHITTHDNVPSLMLPEDPAFGLHR